MSITNNKNRNRVIVELIIKYMNKKKDWNRNRIVMINEWIRTELKEAEL